jgi:hypothetical protein
METFNGQLANRYRAKRVTAHDLWHFCHWVIRNVPNHTVVVWLYVTADVPLPRFPDHLVRHKPRQRVI